MFVWLRHRNTRISIHHVGTSQARVNPTYTRIYIYVFFFYVYNYSFINLYIRISVCIGVRGKPRAPSMVEPARGLKVP